ncbi:hypothetical protein KI387_009525, partial [Taxus chinensis]
MCQWCLHKGKYAKNISIAGEDPKKEIEDEIRNLHSEDLGKVTKTAATLVMLATLPAAESYLRLAASWPLVFSGFVAHDLHRGRSFTFILHGSSSSAVGSWFGSVLSSQ